MESFTLDIVSSDIDNNKRYYHQVPFIPCIINTSKQQNKEIKKQLKF